MNEVETDTETLMHQAALTASDYMRSAQRSIDAAFGDGYAIRHPELVGALVQASAVDFNTSLMKVGLQDLRDVLDAFRLDFGRSAERPNGSIE
jgi:hypothetical protein